MRGVVPAADYHRKAFYARILTHRQVDMLKQIETASDHVISPLQDMEDNLHTPVSFMIIPVFAFANAGISFQGMGFDNLFSGVGLAVMLGLVLGNSSACSLSPGLPFAQNSCACLR